MPISKEEIAAEARAILDEDDEEVGFPFSEAIPKESLDAAAARIQATFRGKHARMHSGTTAPLDPPDNAPSVGVLPPGVRRPSTRVPLLKMKSSAENSNTKIAGPYDKRRSSKTDIAAIKIQSRVRGNSSRSYSNMEAAKKSVTSKGVDAGVQVSGEKATIDLSMIEKQKQELETLKEALEIAKNSAETKEQLAEEANDAAKEKAKTIVKLEHEVAEKKRALGKTQARLREREKALKVSEERIAAVESDLTTKKREVLKHKGVIRRKEDQLSKFMVPKEDVCISARSFNERHLISLRDDLISAKQKELDIVTEKNKEIHSHIETLENQIIRMRDSIVKKSTEYNDLESYNERLLTKISVLERRLLVKQGQKEAVEITTKQNMQLLALLQKEETLTERLGGELADVKGRHETAAVKLKIAKEKSAEHEARALVSSELAAKSKSDTDALRTTWESEKRVLELKLDDVERKFKAKMAAMQDELRGRREKYYSMLNDLQVAQAESRAASDKNERLCDQARIQDELIVKLREKLAAESYRAAKAESLRDEDVVRFEKRQDAISAHCESLSEQKMALSKQLKEMSATVMRVLEKQRTTEVENAKLREDMAARTRQMDESRRRMLQETTLQGKLRIQAEMEHGTILGQLEQLRLENTRLNDMLQVRSAELASISEARKEERRDAHLLHVEASKTCFMRYQKHLSLLGSFLKGRWGSPLPLGDPVVHVDFKKCGLGDNDAKGLLAVFAAKANTSTMDTRGDVHAPLTFSIDLSGNFFTDESVAMFARLVEHTDRRCFLDLRSNQFSHQGIRSLANALQASNTPFPSQMYVHKSGLMECFEGSPGKESGAVVMKVDLRDNPASSLGIDTKTLLVSRASSMMSPKRAQTAALRKRARSRKDPERDRHLLSAYGQRQRPFTSCQPSSAAYLPKLSSGV